MPYRLRRSEHDREIARLAIPALGQLGAEPLYVLVDTAVVGHLGTTELGGLAVAGTLLTTAFWLFNFLAYGTTAAVARLYGAGDDRRAARQAVQSLWLALAIGVGLMLAGALLGPLGMSLMGAEGEVADAGLTYLNISLVGVPAILIALVGMGYLRGLQDTIRPLWVAIVANVANLLIELFLIYGVGWGIEGSAWSTVIAQWGAAAWYLSLIAGHARTHEASWRPAWADLGVLARVGRDLFVRTGALLLALALATAVAARISDTALAAHQVAFQIWIFLALALDAVAIAGQAMIGRFLGAHDVAAARASSRRMLQLGLWCGVLFAVTVLALRPVLGPVFTSDDTVIDVLDDVLVVVALLQPLNAAVFVLDGVLIGAGDFRFLAGAMMVAAAVYAPLALFVNVAGWTLLALWGALGALMLGRLAANYARWRGESWLVVGDVRTG